MLNQINLIGNTGIDPEVKQVGSSKVAAFSLATSETYKDKSGEKVTQTEWHNIVVWGALAEVVEKYVKKGDRLFIGGSVTYRSWDKDGQKFYRTEIKCKELKMLGGKPSSSDPEPAKSETSNDLPF